MKGNDGCFQPKTTQQKNLDKKEESLVVCFQKHNPDIGNVQCFGLPVEEADTE